MRDEQRDASAKRSRQSRDPPRPPPIPAGEAASPEAPPEGPAKGSLTDVRSYTVCLHMDSAKKYISFVSIFQRRCLALTGANVQGHPQSMNDRELQGLAVHNVQ